MVAALHSTWGVSLVKVGTPSSTASKGGSLLYVFFSGFRLEGLLIHFADLLYWIFSVEVRVMSSGKIVFFNLLLQDPCNNGFCNCVFYG